jgi:hypothetical protein
MRYRKKPVVIEAFQMTRERRTDNSEWPNWLHDAWNQDKGTPGALSNVIEGSGDGALKISTLEGEMKIDWDDFIIQGVKGELYPCKPEIFDATYDCVDESEAESTAAE